METERKNLLDYIEENKPYILGLSYPKGYSEHYAEVRDYIMERLRKAQSERKLINFGFTPGENFMKYSKEEYWELMKEVLDNDY